MVAMAILWLTEALPISATALMPMFLLPMLTVQPGKVVCANYFNVSLTYNCKIGCANWYDFEISELQYLSLGTPCRGGGLVV